MSSTPAIAANASAEMRAFNSTFGAVVFTPDGVIIRANNRYLDFVGCTFEELVSESRVALLAGDGATFEDGMAVLRAIVAGEQREQNVFRRRQDGAMRWVRLSYTALKDAQGRVSEIVEIGQDITDKVMSVADERGQIQAINASQAVLHLALDGTVISANQRFADVMGYPLDELAGRHHSIFVDAATAASDDYAAFWARLANGEHRAGEFRHVARDGRDVWLQATYSPICDPSGQPFKIVKYATDVTQERLRQAEYEWQVAAIHKSHAVITFDMFGTILSANDIFLGAMGYSADEVEGRHHRMFVEPSFSHSAEYAVFWRELGKGRHQTGLYRRFGKAGREVWLQASYSPVFDMAGRPVKVVKYATIVTDEKLQQAEHQGQIAAIDRAQCVVSFTTDGHVVDANDNFLELTGYKLSEVRGRHHRLFMPEHAVEGEDYRAFWRALASGEYQAGEYKRIGKGGKEIWLQATYNPILDTSGHPLRIVKYATDITAEKQRQADHHGQIAAISKSQGVMSFGMDGSILDANDNILSMLGYALDEIKGQHHAMLVEADDRDSPAYEAFWMTLRAGQFVSGRQKRVGKAGREIWIQASYNPILDLNGKPYKIVKFATDITADVALAEAYEDAKKQAQYDAATSLPNRTRLAAFLSSALALPAAQVAVLYIDVDRFKTINDTCGHQAGDRVLGEIADRLRRSLRSDWLAARVGGDEFVVVAPGLGEDEVEAYCQRILALAAEPVHHDVNELKVGLSIGVALSPNDATTPDELMRCADAALYRVKESGRGSYCFYAVDMNDRLAANRKLTKDLRRGLARGEFLLEYQPRFEARTQNIRSAEALVRWIHPENGRISPMDFIPLAEKSGLILPLGEWVLNTACATAVTWNGIGVSVNVSPVQFRAGNLVEVVKAALSRSGLKPEMLEIEVTEGVLLEDAERARTALNELKALGVKLAIDDFGTGYASLSYLRHYPFDVIKIDRQFIADIEGREGEGREGGRAIVQAILGLGKALGLSVTAEGVETVGQLATLVLDQCTEVQGYLLARPMPAPELNALLNEQQDEAAPGGADTRAIPVHHARPATDDGAAFEAA